jgi:hypothetical protein
MGGGEFIPNGSVHYNLVNTAGSMKGEDPIKYDDIGGAAHKGHLRVTLRFNSSTEAQEALTKLRGAQAVAANGKWEIVVDIPTNKHTKDQANTDFPNPYAQVRVEW